MWIETQYGDLLNAERYAKIDRELCGTDLYDITLRDVSGDYWEVIAAPLTLGEAKALMGRLANAVAANTYFDIAAELEEVRAEIARFEADAREAKGEALGTDH